MRLRRTRSSLKLTRNSRMRRVIAVERIRIFGELGAAIDGARLRRQARFAHPVAEPAEHALEPPQLGVPLERFEAVHHHLGREVCEPIELLDGHAERVAELRAFRGRDGRGGTRRRVAGQLHPTPFESRIQQGGEPGADVADFDRVHLAARQAFDARRHLIDGAEDDVEGVVVEQRRLRFGRNEQLFELMRYLRDVGEAEHQRGALDAVGLAEGFGDRVHGAGSLLEPQQRVAQRLDPVARFFDELGDEYRGVEGHPSGSVTAPALITLSPARGREAPSAPPPRAPCRRNTPPARAARSSAAHRFQTAPPRKCRRWNRR